MFTIISCSIRFKRSHASPRQNKNQLSEDLQGRARRHLETGYQHQLSFRHDDGSFSAFGMRDESGSTW